MRPLDWAASSVIAVALLLLAGVVFLGTLVPVDVACQMPALCSQVGPFGSVVFAFSRPVQADRVEGLWQTIPATKGRWEWLDDRHVRWRSIEALPSDQATTLQFLPGEAGQHGERIGRPYQWQVSVRLPQIVVLRDEGGGQELFAHRLDNATSETQLTHSDGRVWDYSVSPDGESIAFSAVNTLSGIDLWIVQRDGSNQRKLLDCGGDRCTAPAWSPVTKELAFTRESAGIDPNGPKGAPRIWILAVDTDQSAPLFTDPQKIGYGANWSPDGQWLSIWNGTQGGIEVVDRKTGATFMLESSNGDVGCWSLDGRFLYYSEIVLGGASFRNVVLRADIASGSITTALGGNVEGGGMSFGNPACNPKAPWLAVTVQPNAGMPGGELTMADPETSEKVSIVNDPSRIPNSYSWSPDGDRLVFQMYILGGKANDVEIWVWDRNGTTAALLTRGGRAPQWLP